MYCICCVWSSLFTCRNLLQIMLVILVLKACLPSHENVNSNLRSFTPNRKEAVALLHQSRIFKNHGQNVS